MGFLEEMRRPGQGAWWISPGRICVSADGEIVSEDDERAVSLLVAEGRELPLEVAKGYGLVVEEDAAPEEKPVSKGRKRLEDK